MSSQIDATVAEGEGPLAGIRVLDASTLLAAPLAAGLLGDFGAEVIKVEEPGRGDPIRAFPPNHDGQGLTNKVTNRNKLSVGLDLRSPDGRAVFLDLVAKSDVVILNYRPETLEKWKLDYADLQQVRPDLVMLHLTGFGRTGPHRQRPGFARVAESYAGLTHITGFPDGPPVFAGYPIADGFGGVYGAFSVLLALFHRAQTGRGQLADLALYEPILRMMEDLVIGCDVTGVSRQRHGNVNSHVSPNDSYRTRDGRWVALPSSTANMYTRLCTALDRRDLIEDPRFLDNPSRVKHRKALDAELRPLIEAMDAAQLLEVLQRAGVAVNLVNEAADILEDQHLWERGSLVRLEDPNLGRPVAMPGVFPLLSQTPGSVRWAGREVGQDTRRVLTDLLEYDEPRIEALYDSGSIG